MPEICRFYGIVIKMPHKKNRRKTTKRKVVHKTVIGVAWYSPDEWQQLREVSVDADRLEDTHEEWLAAVKRGLKKMKASGIAPVKVPVDVLSLRNWCREQNLPLDGAARAHYVTEVMRRRDEGPKPRRRQ